MDLQVSGKVALITGSNRGIGKATAITLSKEGVNIALLARNKDLLAQKGYYYELHQAQFLKEQKEVAVKV